MKVFNTSIKHIILLTRVSCSKQDVEESTEQQLAICQKYIKNLGINKFEVYTLEESSSRGNRKKFLQMINDIKTCDGCTALVFTKVDRLLRRFIEVPELDKLRQQGKIQLHAVKNNLVLTKDPQLQTSTGFGFLPLMQKGLVIGFLKKPAKKY